MIIDVVIPWVDGNDPVLNAKRSQYTDERALRHIDEAAPTRFANLGEIYWCVLSINKNAPFVNKIFIVTDGQDPCLGPFLDKNLPDGHIPVEVVDHKVLFRGYEQYLPVFNSVSIESMIWRIPGLSEHYLLMNDDFIIARPVTEEDFFTSDGKVVCYGDRYSIALARILRRLKKRPDGRRVATFKNFMLNSADIEGRRGHFFYLRHTPRPMLRSFLESFFGEHPDMLIRNISHCFRDPEQFSEQELLYLAMDRQGRCLQLQTAEHAFFLQPKPKKDYVAGKLKKLRKGNYKFCCFNSMDMASESDRRMMESWVEETLGL